MNTNNLETEKDKADNYMITACITLIASFAVINSIKQPSDKYISYSYISCLSFLVLSLLFFLWYKFRYPKRKQLYEMEMKKVLNDISGEIANFGEKILIPLKQRQLEEAKQLDKTTPIAKLAENVNKENDVYAKDIITTYLEKINYKSNEKKEEFFNKPLNEKHAFIKNLIDKLSFSLRYTTFTFGILFFLLSIVLTLLK